MKNAPVGPLSQTGGTAVPPSSTPTGSPSHAHQFLKAALSACKRAALSGQKGCFNLSKGPLRPCKRVASTMQKDYLERLKGQRLPTPPFTITSQTPCYQAQMGHRTIVMVHCADNRHGSCMLTVHHDNIQRNRLGIKKCLSQAAQEVKPPATMTILSPLQLVPSHASKSIDNSDASPFIPGNIPPQT